jgi:hypothetical protein
VTWEDCWPGGSRWVARPEHDAKRGKRGFLGGLSLAQLLAQRRGVRNPADPPPLTTAQILAWADAHKRMAKCPLRAGAWRSGRNLVRNRCCLERRPARSARRLFARSAAGRLSGSSQSSGPTAVESSADHRLGQGPSPAHGTMANPPVGTGCGIVPGDLGGSQRRVEPRPTGFAARVFSGSVAACNCCGTWQAEDQALTDH